MSAVTRIRVVVTSWIPLRLSMCLNIAMLLAVVVRIPLRLGFLLTTYNRRLGTRWCVTLNVLTVLSGCPHGIRCVY